MDELEISGKRYISTRRAAREHGYHSDYMGQLIRGKKVKGQKVGRSWYIEENSLNTYLGKAVVPEPVAAPVAPTPEPAPVERLVVEEPAPVPAPIVVPEPAPAPAPVAVAPAPEPVYVAPTPAPAPVHAEVAPAPLVYPAPAPVHTQAPQDFGLSQPRYIEHPPLEETRIPVNTRTVPQQYAASEPQHIGLRYADDDAPTLPTMTRMPQHAPVYAQPEAPARAVHSAFPYISLSVVAAAALVASIFASNFITATIVSEEGKAASVQYSIHW